MPDEVGDWRGKCYQLTPMLAGLEWDQSNENTVHRQPPSKVEWVLVLAHTATRDTVPSATVLHFTCAWPPDNIASAPPLQFHPVPRSGPSQM